MLKRDCVHLSFAPPLRPPGAMRGRRGPQDLVPQCAEDRLVRNDCPATCPGYRPRGKPERKEPPRRS